jgi:hypothetical protein
VALRPVLSDGLPVQARPECRQPTTGSSHAPEKGDAGLKSMGNEPKHLSELIGAGSFAELKREAERRRQETAEIRRLLPPDEAAHLVNAATNAAGELVIMMDTPAWAARVRYCVGVLPNKRVRISVLPRGG